MLLPPLLIERSCLVPGWTRCAGLALVLVAPWHAFLARQVHAQSWSTSIISSAAISPWGPLRPWVTNAAGQVAGTAFTVSDLGLEFEAFRTGASGSAPRLLGHIVPPVPGAGARTSEALAMNELGHVTGLARAADGRFRAIVTEADGSGMRSIGTLDDSPGQFSIGRGVNTSVQVAGYSRNALGESEPFVTAPGASAMRGIGFLGGTAGQRGGWGLAINDAGQVAGWSTNAAGRPEAFLTGASGTSMRGLGFLDGGNDPQSRSEAWAVDGAGRTTGFSTDAAGRTQAFVTDAGGFGMRGLGFGPAVAGPACMLSSRGYGINDAGYVVGEIVGIISGRCRTAAFLATPGGTVTLLETLLAMDGQPGWEIMWAPSVSNNGFIAAQGSHPVLTGGQVDALLLRGPLTTAVPEPSVHLLLATGIASLLLATWRRDRARAK